MWQASANFKGHPAAKQRSLECNLVSEQNQLFCEGDRGLLENIRKQKGKR